MEECAESVDWWPVGVDTEPELRDLWAHRFDDARAFAREAARLAEKVSAVQAFSM